MDYSMALRGTAQRLSSAARDRRGIGRIVRVCGVTERPLRHLSRAPPP